MTRLSDNIRQISAHDALLILIYSLSTPRILHRLRCSPCHNYQTMTNIDNLLRANICRITNVDLSEIQWTQASVPNITGDLGKLHGASSALPTFLLCQALHFYKILFYFAKLDHLTIYYRSTLL